MRTQLRKAHALPPPRSPIAQFEAMPPHRAPPEAPLKMCMLMGRNAPSSTRFSNLFKQALYLHGSCAWLPPAVARSAEGESNEVGAAASEGPEQALAGKRRNHPPRESTSRWGRADDASPTRAAR